jgi:hypothetical protein
LTLCALLACAAPALCHAKGKPPPLRAQDLDSGLRGLGEPAGEHTFMSDQFKYEYGDPDKKGCQRVGHDEREDNCYHRVPAVPEPSTYALMGVGLGALLLAHRLRNRKQGRSGAARRTRA